MNISAYTSGNEFILGESHTEKFQLEFNSFWNDWGYYTSFIIRMKIGESNWKQIGGIRIMDRGQEWNKYPTGCDSYSFICSPITAINLFLFLTPQQRRELEQKLNIVYNESYVRSEKVFIKSICRDQTIYQFQQEQTRIKSIMQSSTDGRNFIKEYKSILKNELSLYEWFLSEL